MRWSGCGRRWPARPANREDVDRAVHPGCGRRRGILGSGPDRAHRRHRAVLTVVIGVLTPRSAVRALNWNILAVIAGSVGLGTIVVESGLGAHISGAILALSSGSTALVVLEIAVVTTLLTNVITAAAAAILTPVTLAIAASTGLNPCCYSR